MPSLSARERLQILNTLWVGMVCALACSGVIHLMAVRVELTGGLTPLLTPVLAGLSLVVYFMAWRRVTRAIGEVTVLVSPERFMRLGPSEKPALQNRLQAAVIVSLALIDAPPVLGLINSVLGTREAHLFEWCAGISLVSLLILKSVGYPALRELFQKLETREGMS